MKHTKGPWELQKITNGYRIITNGIYTMNLDGPWYPSPAQAEAFEANARLIAAAPELLEAAEQVVSWLHGRGYDSTALEMAISKAKGD